MIEMWLRKDPTRWLAGALAGLFAMTVALVVAGVVSKSAGYEIWFPIKLGAIPVYSIAKMSLFQPFVSIAGASDSSASAATLIGIMPKALLAGVIFWGVVAMVLGATYAHFSVTSSLLPLLGVGFVWGTFSWIFIGNLFLPAWRGYTAAHISKGAFFLVVMVFGLMLASTGFFDRMIRGSRGATH